MAPVSERLDACVAPLLTAPRTLIHGEYTPHNVLFRDGSIYPVDWESAAIAAGAIDLAGLTDRWPADVVRACEFEYERARWPDGAPAQFNQELAAARLYWQSRWLGQRPDWTTDEECLWRFDELRSAAETMGLV